MDSEQDKSELPTPYKLERSRQKGVVARGMDLGFLSGLAAVLGYAWMEGPTLGRTVERAGPTTWSSRGPALARSNASLLPGMSAAFFPVLRPMLLLFASVFLVVLVAGAGADRLRVLGRAAEARFQPAQSRQRLQARPSRCAC